jgi:cytoskeletal protein RodZ
MKRLIQQHDAEGEEAEAKAREREESEREESESEQSSLDDRLCKYIMSLFVCVCVCVCVCIMYVMLGNTAQRTLLRFLTRSNRAATELHPSPCHFACCVSKMSQANVM